MIRRPPRSTPLYSSAASDVYKRQVQDAAVIIIKQGLVDHTLIADPEINMSATLIKLARLQ